MNTQLILSGKTITLFVQGFRLKTAKGEIKYARLRVSTGKTIVPDMWNEKAQRPKVDYSQADGFALEQELNTMITKMNVAYAKASREEQLTPDRVRELFEDLNGSTVKPTAVALVDMRVLDLIREMETKAESSLTGAAYRAFSSKVEGFDAKVKVSGLTDDWRDRFYAHVQAVYNLNENSMWSVAKMTNKVINESKRRGLRITISSTHPFTLTTPQTDYLDWSDLRKLIAHRPKTDRLQEIKTHVLAMALTSVRISDLWSLYKSLTIGEGTVTCSGFHTKKKCGSKHPFIMPYILRPLAEQIIKHGIPGKRSEDGIRVGIQDLMMSARIKKASVIGPHDLRRSFLTNFIGFGVFSDTLLAKLFSGHALNGERSVMHGYDQGDLAAKQRTFVRILSTVPLEDVGGIKLL